MKKILWVLTGFLIFSSCFCCASCGVEKKQISTYDIVVQIDDNVVNGKETVTFYNDTDNSFSQLKFNLFANAFRENAKYSPVSFSYEHSCYPNGKSYGDIQILSVESKGEGLKFEISGEDENILKVTLNEEVFPEESVSVDITFKVTLANVIARTGYNDKTINLANFYPILCGISDGAFYECVYYSSGDPFFSDVADYNVSITCDSDLIVASSGELVERVSINDKTTYIYSLLSARSYAVVLSKDFECMTDTSLGVRVNYYFYDDTAPEKAMTYALKSLKLFNDIFGEYPYSTYSVVQTKFVQGGMEFPTLVMISDGLETEAYGEVVVHETAHQWWQTTVGNNEIEYGFLDEGLAEYSVILFYENYPEYNLKRESLVKSAEQTYKTYCTVYDKLFGETNTKMLRSLKDFTSEYEYVNLAYVKSAIMYDTLRTTVKEETFFNSLKKYYNDNKFKNATPYDLIASFERCGVDVAGYFESFFNGEAVI